MQPEKPLAAILVANRKLIWRLAKAQVRDRYASTLLGSVWAIVHPALMLLVFWFVFEYGLKISQSGPIPFFLTLIVGLAAWIVFNDAVVAGINAVTSSSHLVKKLAFPLEILPVVPVVSACIVHACIMGVVLVIMAINGYMPGRGFPLVLYYAACMAVLAVGLNYLFSALNAVHRDIGQMAAMMVQLWFWLTPIVWLPDAFSPAVRAALEYNPIHYVVMGYRDALLMTETSLSFGAGIRFWVVTLPIAALGFLLFRRLKHDFADLL